MLYEATVLDNRDTTSAGKLMVHCPQVFGPKASDWVYGSSPVVGHNSGFFAVPEVGSTVLVCNAKDSLGHTRPYWIAGCWDQLFNNLPDVTKIYKHNYAPDTQMWKTQLGHSITLSEFVFVTDDADGGPGALIQENYVDIRSAGGKYLKFDDGVSPEDEGGPFDFIELSDELANSIRIQTGVSDDKTKVQGTIIMQTENGYDIESDTGNTEIAINEGDGAITIKHYDKGSANVEAMTINIKGEDINIEAGDGEDHDIECDHTLTDSQGAPGVANVTGTITCPVKKHANVKINGSTAITLQ